MIRRLRVTITTGARLGELLGLKWEDVDLDAKTLSVKRTLFGVEGGYPVFSTPKIAKSRRTVPLSRVAVKALECHGVAQDEERTRLGTLSHDTGLVFRSTTSTPVNRHNLMKRSFEPLLREALVASSAAGVEEAVGVVYEAEKHGHSLFQVGE